MTLNAWNHVAITRSGQTVRGFLNGVLGTTITLSSAGVSLVDQANPLMLGAQILDMLEVLLFTHQILLLPHLN